MHPNRPAGIDWRLSVDREQGLDRQVSITNDFNHPAALSWAY